jgi:hypothetical protein
LNYTVLFAVETWDYKVVGWNADTFDYSYSSNV